MPAVPPAVYGVEAVAVGLQLSERGVGALLRSTLDLLREVDQLGCTGQETLGADPFRDGALKQVERDNRHVLSEQRDCGRIFLLISSGLWAKTQAKLEDHLLNRRGHPRLRLLPRRLLDAIRQQGRNAAAEDRIVVGIFFPFVVHRRSP